MSGRYAIIEAFGLDKVGIIAKVSGILSQANCNIEDSCISRLGQALAMMLLIRLPEEITAKKLMEKLAPIQEELGLNINIAELSPETVVSDLPAKPHAQLICHGADKIGIVHNITKFLAEQSINIIDMHTTVLRREKPEYVMELTLELPSFIDINKLNMELAKLGEELGVNVFLR